ncbi:hypothetical protein MLP_33660 [Microlunatus phosphovorus NM-1]|uniref:Uncharacterized protein n=1 Tax=Microlunatus phosphovorus (strain ATCC 700054 / DSM 10555 / JCM 9379 / NBRC 101784 / NCIMB 13414 / VKM Ac-1990 / NM-1) TaxID=1032480 RepID=F5XMC3_MICPN|nr:hypothetical protein MLP_33660 [Microlunatus phosphovorus NM-1]
MHARSTNHGGAGQTQLGALLEGLLNGPQAISVREQAMDLPSGHRGAGAHQSGKDGPSGSWHDSAERFAEVHMTSVPVM